MILTRWLLISCFSPKFHLFQVDTSSTVETDVLFDAIKTITYKGEYDILSKPWVNGLFTSQTRLQNRPSINIANIYWIALKTSNTYKSKRDIKLQSHLLQLVQDPFICSVLGVWVYMYMYQHTEENGYFSNNISGHKLVFFTDDFWLESRLLSLSFAISGRFQYFRRPSRNHFHCYSQTSAGDSVLYDIWWLATIPAMPRGGHVDGNEQTDRNSTRASKSVPGDVFLNLSPLTDVIKSDLCYHA